MISKLKGANTYNYPCLLHLRTNVSQNDARVKKLKKLKKQIECGDDLTQINNVRLSKDNTSVYQ